MLLEFRTRGYKSFVDEAVFSLVPAKHVSGHEYGILHGECGTAEATALSTAVIYGPNAAGKSNLIGAIAAMRAMVLRGNLDNAEDSGGNHDECRLGLIPTSFIPDPGPTCFGITFHEAGLTVTHAFKVRLGRFMETGAKRRVLEESMVVNGEPVYSRTGKNLTIGQPTESLSTMFPDSVLNNLSIASDMAESSLDESELFLTNGFKAIISPVLARKVLDWFRHKLVIIRGRDPLDRIRNIHADVSPVAGDTSFAKAMEEFGFGPGKIGYAVLHGSDKPVLVSRIQDAEGTSLHAVPAKMFESSGTLRFAGIYPAIEAALLRGATLFLDDCDGSFHSSAVMNLVTVFHNDNLNKYKAQLVFNTHNPIYMDSRLLRTDEIMFVDRDKDTYRSTHYSLADFVTGREGGLGNDEDHLANYFIKRYGAIRAVDLSECLEEVLMNFKTMEGRA